MDDNLEITWMGCFSHYRLDAAEILLLQRFGGIHAELANAIPCWARAQIREDMAELRGLWSTLGDAHKDALRRELCGLK